MLPLIKNLKERLKGGEQVFESEMCAKDMKKVEQCWISDVQRTL